MIMHSGYMLPVLDQLGEVNALQLPLKYIKLFPGRVWKTVLGRTENKRELTICTGSKKIM